MQKNLVIVESPAKAKTIGSFLGKDFKVLSSYGHIRDLSKQHYGIDIENRFEPEYIISDDKKKVVEELKKAAKQAEVVWLASDEDREGEAIAWHLSEVLKLKDKDTRRIVFHEITKTAIEKAVQNPREIDLHLVDAQQARRVLDRLVGFELSPVLWRRIKANLSAGRVQSVAVRLIVEREAEINQFQTSSTYRTIAVFATSDGEELKAELNKRFETEVEAKVYLEQCIGNAFKISAVEKKPAKRSPAPPFTTSTLQQEAARKLGFSVTQTMRVAQTLYEEGHITYMRTDSVNLSSLAMNTIKAVIEKSWGAEYHQPRNYKTKSKGAQEAHEAIRPTYADREIISGTQQQQKLYDLIRKRAIASQMADARLERTIIEIRTSADGVPYFQAQGETVVFPGFLEVYMESSEEDENGNSPYSMLMPNVHCGESLHLNEIMATEKYSQHPPRYSEAALVRKMEELGIGRPSTYAPTIQTIQNRGYVERGDKPAQKRKYVELSVRNGELRRDVLTENFGADRGKLLPTDIGVVVNDFLMEYFPDIVNFNFTADVEEQFDRIADGKQDWHDLIERFYDKFHPQIEKEMIIDPNTQRVGERILGNDPKTGRVVSVRIGRYGPMAQIGTPEDDEKPLFAKLLPGQSITTITLEEALKLLSLPRHLGQYREAEVTVSTGRFGPYVRFRNKFVSIPKTMEMMSISLEEAIALIDAKEEAEQKSLLKTFEEKPDLEIRLGRFGAYIKYEGCNYKIPKSNEHPEELTLEECMKLIAEGGTSTSKKKVAAKSKTMTARKKTATTSTKKTAITTRKKKVEA